MDRRLQLREGAYGQKAKPQQLVCKKNLCHGDVLKHEKIQKSGALKRPSRFCKLDEKPVNIGKSTAFNTMFSKTLSRLCLALATARNTLSCRVAKKTKL